MRTRYATIVMEDIYQPNNASAVLRTCDCFGIQDVHIIENQNQYTLDTEVSLGSEKWLSITRYKGHGNNSEKAMKKLKKSGYRIIATSPHKKETLLPDLDIAKGKFAIVMGTELTGISDTVKHYADESLMIPMYGFAESFNISVSAALILQSVRTKLQSSNVKWHLTTADIHRIKLDWLRKSIKSIDLIEKRYLESKK